MTVDEVAREAANVPCVTPPSRTFTVTRAWPGGGAGRSSASTTLVRPSCRPSTICPGSSQFVLDDRGPSRPRGAHRSPPTSASESPDLISKLGMSAGDGRSRPSRSYLLVISRRRSSMRALPWESSLGRDQRLMRRRVSSTPSGSRLASLRLNSETACHGLRVDDRARANSLAG